MMADWHTDFLIFDFAKATELQVSARVRNMKKQLREKNSIPEQVLLNHRGGALLPLGPFSASPQEGPEMIVIMNVVMRPAPAGSDEDVDL